MKQQYFFYVTTFTQSLNSWPKFLKALLAISSTGVLTPGLSFFPLWQCVSFSAVMEELGISLQCYKGIRRRSRPHSGARSACIFCQPKRTPKREGARRDSSTWALDPKRIDGTEIRDGSIDRSPLLGCLFVGHQMTQSCFLATPVFILYVYE